MPLETLDIGAWRSPILVALLSLSNIIIGGIRNIATTSIVRGIEPSGTDANGR
jgi:hypothetical protein